MASNLSLLASALLFTSPAADARPLPQVSFAHPGLIENYCSAVSPVKPNPQVLAEIDAMMPRFVAAWAEEGAQLMRTTVAITGRPYEFSETLATLHGCPDLASLSMPLLIAVMRHTQAWAALPGPDEPVAGLGPRRPRPPAPRQGAPLARFTYVVWHELGHRYVNDIKKHLPGGTTPLLKRYADEPPIVRNHLHLFALDRLLYERLGRASEYESRKRQFEERSPSLYGRALAIVDREGAQAFVAELRAPQSP